ncbi:hypothetical protein, partial [Vibrio cholerae]|uniref:hypothetical protein n=1 Tax=Vibrio cholerae TaxID=666 RepID=UPI00301DAF66
KNLHIYLEIATFKPDFFFKFNSDYCLRKFEEKSANPRCPYGTGRPPLIKHLDNEKSDSHEGGEFTLNLRTSQLTPSKAKDYKLY